VKTVADTLGVSRSQLHERLNGEAKPRARYRKAEDPEILSEIRTLTDGRPTYGYRRVWALLNRQRSENNLAKLNHKRIYRLMSQNGLLLQRYTGKPPGRAHDGQIITIRPNLRWTTDSFEIPCWNNTVVGRDQGALHVATTGGLYLNLLPESGGREAGAEIVAQLRSRLSLAEK
jgi:putative transposase